MTEKFTRRSVLASATTLATVGLAGCASTPDECEPASFPTGTATPREEPPKPCQYGAELETKGLDVDSTLGMSGSVSVMYYRDPDLHKTQIRRVAETFVPYRRMVEGGKPLSFTALSSNEDRHGNGYIAREWADERANGDMSQTEYVTRARGTYGTV
jgi:hypothetical protein